METDFITEKPPNYRVVMIGNSSVGKTSILHRLIFDKFHEQNNQTVGAAFSMHTINVDGEKVSLQIWDTAGQERYKSIGPIYYRNSGAAVIVYDQTEEVSFTCIPNWVAAFQEAALPEGRVYIVGNKKDKLESISVPEETAIDFCKEKKYKFYSVSALTGEGIQQIFYDVAKDFLLYDQQKKQELRQNEPKHVEEKKTCC